jgi:transposase-like protein
MKFTFFNDFNASAFHEPVSTLAHWKRDCSLCAMRSPIHQLQLFRHSSHSYAEQWTGESLQEVTVSDVPEVLEDATNRALHHMAENDI